MKNRILFLLVLVAATLTSCLKANLKELPVSSADELNNASFEYRYTNVDRPFEMSVAIMSVELVENDTENHVKGYKVTVPLATSTFPEDIREDVSLENLVCYLSISEASTVKPYGDSPALGKPQDWSSKEGQYTITAADGKTSTLWTVKIVEFAFAEAE